jgi:sec-independent protein translocase protein TatA
MLDGQTLLLVLLIFILLFGTNKLPELARSLGKAVGEFKKAQIETTEDVHTNESRTISQNIIKLATDLGINTKGKDENLLLDEIKAVIKANSK